MRSSRGLRPLGRQPAARLVAPVLCVRRYIPRYCLNLTQKGIGGISMTSNTQQAMTFGNAISTCFSKFFDFKGRATRPEFWWFYLFTVLLSWGAILVEPSQVLSSIINLILFFPVIAAGARRLHDTNRSGWWQLLMLTVIGLIPLIIWMASEGNAEENKYGNPA